MKTYYITIAEKGQGSWDSIKQMSFEAESWKDAVTVAKGVSMMFKTEVRLCESQGYNNQGTYILQNRVL